MNRYSICGRNAKGQKICVNVVGEHVKSVTVAPIYTTVLKGDFLLLPAAIDLHTHLRGLKLSYKEDVSSATMAAAVGGVAVVAEMPNTVPQLRTVEAVKEKLAELDSQSFVDYVVYAGLPENVEELSRIVRMPIVGFKIYPEDFKNPLLCKVMWTAAKYGKLVMVHAEHPDTIPVEAGWPAERNVLRSCVTELTAVRVLAELSLKCGQPRIHVTHVSCPETLRLAHKYGFTTDTTLHHILLAALGSSSGNACLYKVNPPLREDATRYTLLLHVIKGLVDVIASDHAPHAGWEKSMHPLLCPPGIAAIEYWLPLAYTAIGDSYLLVKLVSKAPAEILGLRRRGELAPTNYADMAILDVESFTRIYGNKFSKARYTGFEGFTVKAEVVALYVRGRRVYSRDEGITVEEGFGVNALTYGLK